MVGTCKSCGEVIAGPENLPVFGQAVSARIEADWWGLAERVVDHAHRHHRDEAGFFIDAAGEVVRRVEAMRLISSSDADFAPMLRNVLAGLCDRMAPEPV